MASTSTTCDSLPVDESEQPPSMATLETQEMVASIAGGLLSFGQLEQSSPTGSMENQLMDTSKSCEESTNAVDKLERSLHMAPLEAQNAATPKTPGSPSEHSRPMTPSEVRAAQKLLRQSSSPEDEFVLKQVPGTTHFRGFEKRTPPSRVPPPSGLLASEQRASKIESIFAKYDQRNVSTGQKMSPFAKSPHSTPKSSQKRMPSLSPARSAVNADESPCRNRLQARLYNLYSGKKATPRKEEPFNDDVKSPVSPQKLPSMKKMPISQRHEEVHGKLKSAVEHVVADTEKASSRTVQPQKALSSRNPSLPRTTTTAIPPRLTNQRSNSAASRMKGVLNFTRLFTPNKASTPLPVVPRSAASKPQPVSSVRKGSVNVRRPSEATDDQSDLPHFMRDTLTSSLRRNSSRRHDEE